MPSPVVLCGHSVTCRPAGYPMHNKLGRPPPDSTLGCPAAGVSGGNPRLLGLVLRHSQADHCFWAFSAARQGTFVTIEKSLAASAIQMLRLPQVCRVTGLCRSMIYRLEACENFPRRIKIGSRAVGWVEGEVQEWLTKRIESGRCHQHNPHDRLRRRHYAASSTTTLRTTRNSSK